jgi:DNA-binding MarR family transcriptional regulator
MSKIHSLKIYKEENTELVEERDLKPNEKLFLYLLKELKADAYAGVSLSLTELGERVGFNRNTTSKAVTALHKAGYLIYTKGKGRLQGTIKLTLDRPNPTYFNG